MRLDNRLVYCALVAPIVMVAGLGLLPRGAMAQTDACDGWVALHDMLPRRYPVMVQTADGPLLWGGTLLKGPNDTDQLLLHRTATCETWRFDGTRWRFVTLEGPSPRFYSAGSYDSARDRVVLFGGMTYFQQYITETWEFGEGRWTLRQTANAPTNMARHAMVFDPSRQLTYLYGRDQFWSYDGDDWTQIASSGLNPGPQSFHKLVFDPRDNSILLVPRSSTSAAWKWTGTTWSQLSASGVDMSDAFFDATRNSIVIASSAGTFYTFDGSVEATAVGPDAPSLGMTLNPSCLPTATGDWLVVVGPVIPFSSTAYNPSPPPSFVVSQAGGWAESAARSSPRATVYMCFDYFPPTNEFVLFGGNPIHAAGPLRETWLLRGETWRQHTGPQPPVPLSNVLEYFPPRQASVLMQHFGSGNELWSWSRSGWSSEQISTADLRPGTSLRVFDDRLGAIVMPRTIGVTQSVVVFDGGFTVWPASNVSTSGSASTFDPHRQRVVIAGGLSNQTYELIRSEQTGAFDWAQITTGAAQTGSDGSSMAYVPERGGLVLFGGLRGTANDLGFPRATFFLSSDATVWTILPFASNAPTGRQRPGMAYDPVARRIIMYGGLQMDATYPLRETWKLARGPAAVALEPVDTYVVPGETGEAFIIASGGGVIQYQWFKDGVALANSGRITGADSDTLQIQNFTSADNGNYHVTVHNPCGDDESIAVQLRAIPACPGDFNDSGGVDATDLAEFFDAYQRGLMLADVDLSGGIDASDMALFIESFQAGGC